MENGLTVLLEIIFHICVLMLLMSFYTSCCSACWYTFFEFYVESNFRNAWCVGENNFASIGEYTCSSVTDEELDQKNNYSRLSKLRRKERLRYTGPGLRVRVYRHFIFHVLLMSAYLTVISTHTTQMGKSNTSFLAHTRALSLSIKVEIHLLLNCFFRNN